MECSFSLGFFGAPQPLSREGRAALSVGGPEVVEIRDVEMPEPGDGEVRVRVRAASVNRADLDWLKPRPGFARLFLGMRAPRDPRMGWDVAGEVDAVGAGVTRWKPGDAVMADLANHGGGSFAEYVVAKEDAFGTLPKGMDFVQASTLPHSAVLALQGLRTRKGQTPKAGDRVLVVGASGNVGPFAVQIAKAMGAHVTGVASRSKVDMVRSSGPMRCSTTSRSTTRAPAGAGTGSWSATRITRS